MSYSWKLRGNHINNLYAWFKITFYLKNKSFDLKRIQDKLSWTTIYCELSKYYKRLFTWQFKYIMSERLDNAFIWFVLNHLKTDTSYILFIQLIKHLRMTSVSISTLIWLGKYLYSKNKFNTAYTINKLYKIG